VAVTYHLPVSRLPAAVLLDLDDTILDDTGCVDECWADACARAEQLVTGIRAAELQKTIQEHASWWWSDRERNRTGRLDLRKTTGSIVAEAFRRLGHDDAEAAFSVANHYRDLREERARLHEGAIETIEWLRRGGVRLGMMTNGAGPSQRAKIERFKLASHFDHIVIEGEFGVGKPDRRVFASLLETLRVEPAQTWAVGDNLEADVLGAMALGIYGVWVDRSGRGVRDGIARQPDRIIGALRDLITTG